MDKDRIAEKVAHYSPDSEVLASLRVAEIVLLVAPSGTGKNSIINYLLEKYPDRYRFLLSHTTRSPRINNGVMELEGINYHYINLGQAERLLDDKQYVEANWYAGNVYGLTAGVILAAHREGKVAINEIEVQGANDFAKRVPTARTVFILPPSYGEWLRRLKSRYGQSAPEYAEDLHRRLEAAKFELENAVQHSHFYLVVNDAIENAAKIVHDIAEGKDVTKRSPEALALAKEILRRLNEAL